jgi:hypothetical protein
MIKSRTKKLLLAAGGGAFFGFLTCFLPGEIYNAINVLADGFRKKCIDLRLPGYTLFYDIPGSIISTIVFWALIGLGIGLLWICLDALKVKKTGK